MALLDFLKRKKEAEKSKKKVSTEKKVEKTSVTKKEVNTKQPTTSPEKQTVKAGKKKGFSYEVVREPHISEKSTILGENGKYTFKVQHAANKPEIKKAVEGIYGVNVVNVNLIKIPKKKRRIGRTEGFRKGYIKAVVTVKEGQKIEIF